MSPKRSEAELKFWDSGQSVTLKSKRECRFWGSGSRVIFLVHGWESRGATYYKFIEKFIQDDYTVYAWDGPAHGNTKQRFTDIFNFTKALASDIKELEHNVDTMIGHSFGGACLGILNDFMTLPKNMIFIAAPSTLHTALYRFKKIIKLNQESFKAFVQLCETQIGDSVDKLSLTSRRIDQERNCLVIHDEDDRDIPFKDFEELKSVWTKASFYKTKGLGHKRIIKDINVANKILEFIR